MALTLSGTNGVVGAGFTLDPSGASVTAGVGTFSSARVGAAVTISESGIEASGIGITVANINGGKISGRRNIIINGAMNVAQRGTSSTDSGYGSVDRFRVAFTGTDESPTQSQVDVASGTTPYTLGFRKALKVTNGNQTGGAGASDQLDINCRIEGQDIAGSGWNYTSSSSFITLSFWVKSSVEQNFYGYVRSVSGTVRSHPYETGSLTADTWTKITKTFSGDSNITINNDNSVEFNFYLVPFFGTGLTASGVSLTAWNTFDTTAILPDNTATWYETDNATLEITGVQLEVGSQATAFEHRSYGEELLLCQRYYFKETAVSAYMAGYGSNPQSYGLIQLSQPNSFRATPTITVTGSQNASSVGTSAQSPFYSIVYCNTSSSSAPRLTGYEMSSEL